MKKIKIISIFGTRPEAIKMCPLIKELDKNKNIENIVCVTAQHREMLDQVLNIFNIVPDYDLNIMKETQSLVDITINVLQKLNSIFVKEKPDLVLVHGDTTTTLSGALAAFYNKIPVGHVEAGLRTNHMYSPFPEEGNRVLTGHLATLHFAPTETSLNNLLKEGINKNNIFVTGNTVIDAMKDTIKDNYKFKNGLLNTLDFSKRTIMVTAHRRENWDRLSGICLAIKKLATDYSDINVVYLMHLNPVVQNTVKSHLSGIDNIYLLPPVDMEDMHNLMNKSFFIMTDSGGIQEEAPHLGKPVLVLRDTTERPEAIEAGTVELTGNTYEEIFISGKELLNNTEKYNKMANAVNPYGDGTASKQIVERILKYFNINF